MLDTLARPQAPWALRLVPPFPAIAQRVLAVVNREDVDLREVGELVKMDPSFSAELLRVANSALFGARREIKSLVQAISMIGLDRVRSMATLVAVNRMVRSSLRIVTLRKVWVHSLVTAMIADEAARVARSGRDIAYTAGLLHNLGTLGLMSAYPQEYTRMLEVSDDYGFDLLTTERDLFDINHCEAGAYLAQDWDFPDELVSSIQRHHEEPAERKIGVENLVRIAWRLADTLGYAAFSPDKLWPYDRLVGMLPESRNSWLCGSPETACKEITERMSAAPM
jgi:putative nucleotidyltransferase with HDIG domain